MAEKRMSIALGAGLLVALVAAFALRWVAALEVGEALTIRAGGVRGALVVFALLGPAMHLLATRWVLPVLVANATTAFPRLQRLGIGFYVLGTVLLLASSGLGTAGEVSPGWSFLMAWSPALVGSWVYPLAGGVVLLVLSMGVTALGCVVSLHRARARGQRWKELPALAWSLYAQSVLLLVAAPIAVVAVTLLVVDRSLGAGLFDPASGGDPVLFLHLFWLAARTLVLCAVLPVLGVAIDVVRGMSGRRPEAPPVVWGATLALALTAPLGWAQHVPEPASVLALFTSLANILSVTLIMLLVGHLLATLRRGSVLLASPLLYALAAGVMAMFFGWVGLGSAPVVLGGALELRWFGTYGLDVLLAATLLAVAAGLLYWWPRLVQRQVDETQGRVAFALHALGLVAYFGAGPSDLLGSPWGLAAAGHRLGAGLALAGTVVLVWGLVRSLRGSAPAELNPWSARGHEWLPTELALPPAK